MLTKEHIRQAIEIVSKRDPEIGYTLDEMLSTGRIALAKSRPDSRPGEDLYFLFDGTPVTIRRIIFFNAGTVPIEEKLLIKYGEMVKKQQYAKQTPGVNFQEAARDIQASGIRFMVEHEIDHAVMQLKQRLKNPDPDCDIPFTQARRTGAHSDEADRWQETVHRYKSIKKNRHELSSYLPPGKNAASLDFCYWGALNRDERASFIRFPYCMDALMQVADINLEFFHVRFLLSCLARGLDNHLFTCIVNNRIEGMVYLTFKKSYLYRALEIQYIATVRGRPTIETDSTSRVVKGVGTLLIAGVWMVWKTHYREAKDLLLDSEVGARSFYEAIGFQSRGFSGFALKKPQGRLVKAIMGLAAHRQDLPGDLMVDITAIVKEQFRILRKKNRRQHMIIKRKLALESIQACFQAGANAALVKTVMHELNRHQRSIPESADLFRLIDEVQ